MKKIVNKILLPVPAQLAELGDTIERLLNTQHIQLESITVQVKEIKKETCPLTNYKTLKQAEPRRPHIFIPFVEAFTLFFSKQQQSDVTCAAYRVCDARHDLHKFPVD